MKDLFKWDPDVDAAYIKLADRRIFVSEQVRPGIVIDYDRENKVVGIEILNFCSHFATPRKAKSLRRELTKILPNQRKQRQDREPIGAQTQV